MDKIVLDREDSVELIYGSIAGYTAVKDWVKAKGRWTEHHVIVIKDTSTGNFYEAEYEVGLTENCDPRPWEYEEKITWTRVYPKQKTRTIYTHKE